MKLLLTGAYNYSDEQLEKLSSLGFDITFLQMESDTLSNFNEFDAVVCNALFLYHDINKFSNLKYIQVTSAALDRLPLEYIQENNIKLFNARGVYSVPMAEWALLKILEIYKNSRNIFKNQQIKQWEKQRDILELFGKTFAVLGVGSVGEEVCKRLKAFDVKVIGIDLFPIKSEFVDEVCHIDNLKSVLPKVDGVILTLPLTSQTENLFSGEMLDCMKDESVLINIARGKIIDEKALVEKANKFKGIALDVFEEEPLNESSPLWSFDNILISPHNSFVSISNSARLFDVIFKNLSSFKEIL